MRFKVFFWTILLTSIALLAGCNFQREVEEIPIHDFFGKPDRTSFKVSPDGRRIAYLGLEEHCKNIFILDIVHPDSSKQLTYQKNMNVQYFFWTNSDSIVYSNSQSAEDSLRLAVINIHTDQSTSLLKPKKYALRWVKTTASKEGDILAQINSRDSTIFDLFRIPLDGSGPQLVDRNPGNFSGWFASEDGKVRVAVSSDSVEDGLWFRAEENLPFKNILETDFSTTVMPIGPVKGEPTSFYALSNVKRDKQAVVKINLTNGKEEIVAANEVVDMNREGYLFSRQEIIYSSSFDKKKETKIYNPKLDRIYNKLLAEFKGFEIDIVDVDSAFQTVVFKTYTDVDPGGVYYYSAIKDKVVELTTVNPYLEGKTLAKMQEISYSSRDGKTIHGYLTLPVKKQKKYPVVVLIHDGPNRRDLWGFNPEVQFLANRGYAVFQVNYRGSVGYGKAFFKAGFKQWGGEIQNDINDGVAWLIHQGVADKDHIAMMGTGFGGYSALYAACFNPTMYKCVISNSGFTNLFTYFKEIPPYYTPYLQLYYNILGDPTKEYELFKAISPLFHADKVRMPVLLFHGGKDKHNSMTDVHQFVQKVKNNGVPITYIYREDEGRRFKKEENIITYYQEIEGFLKQQMH